MQEFIVAFAAMTGISAVGLVVVAAFWLKKFRETVASALAESANQQIQTAQRFSEAIAQLQKLQRGQEQKMQSLAQANAQLRQGLVTVATQIQHGQQDAARVEPTIH